MVERIIELIKINKMSINSVEKKLGFGNGAIKRFDTNSPSINKLIKLSNFLNVSLQYIVFGTSSNNELKINTIKRCILNDLDNINDLGIKKVIERIEELSQLQKYIKVNLNTNSDIKNKSQISNIMEVKFFETPVFAEINPSIFNNAPYHIKKVDLTLVPHARKSDFALYIRGDSMEDKYLDGDILFIKEQSFIDDGQIGVFIYDNDILIKKYTKNKDGQIYLISLNPIYKPIKIKEDIFFKICGLVL